MHAIIEDYQMSHTYEKRSNRFIGVLNMDILAFIIPWLYFRMQSSRHGSDDLTNLYTVDEKERYILRSVAAY